MGNRLNVWRKLIILFVICIIVGWIQSVSAAPTALVFITLEQTISIGDISDMIAVQTQDGVGNPVGVPADTIVQLSSSNPATGKFYSDAAGTNQITLVVIPAGQNIAFFYYSDITVGDAQITADESPDQGWTAATQIVHVVEEISDITVSPTILKWIARIGTSEKRCLSVSNDGYGILEVTNITVNDAAFSVSEISFIVAPGANHEVTVTFTPQDEGTITATLTIFSNDPDEDTFPVSLSGTGCVHCGIYDYGAAIFTVEKMFLLMSKLQCEGSLLVNTDLDINFSSHVDVDGIVAVGGRVNVDAGSTLEADEIIEGVENIEVPQLDFEQYKKRADYIYTDQEFQFLLDHGSPLTLNGINYVIGSKTCSISIKNGQKLILNGFLLTDCSFNTNGFADLVINNTPGQPSGLASKKGVTINPLASLKIAGLLHSLDDIIINAANAFSLSGGIINFGEFLVLNQINKINIIYDEEIIRQALAAPPDTISPTPNTIASIVAVSSTQIDITSTEAQDDTPPVFYRLDGQYYDGVAWVDSSGEVSDYDYSTTRPNPWSDTNLFENGWYRYRQKVKDSANPPNESAWSDWVEKATLLNPPQDAFLTFANITTTGMDVTVATPLKLSGTGSTGAYFDIITGEGKGSGATDRGYADDYIAEYTNLNPNTQYGWKVKYRNRDGVETAYNPTEQKRYTLANTPSAPTVSNPTGTTLDVEVNPSGNPDYTLFAIYNVTGVYYLNASGGNNGAAEVWQTKSAWGTVTVVNLTPETTYEFKCKAKNGDSIETPFGPSDFGTTAASPASTIKILPESQSTKIGKTATINIQIENVADLGGFEFKLRYKTNIIEITESDIQAGAFLTSTGKQVINATPKFSTEGDDTVLFYGVATYGDQPPASSTGILATIALKGIGAGTTTLDLFEVQVGDANANPISVDAIDGSITVESILYGDVSDNGFITAYDASLVLQYVVGLIELSPEQQKAADVTDNGTISALDAALILQYTVGLITKFPVEGVPVAPALNPPKENWLLTKAIEQLEIIPLTREQKQVLEQLKNLVFSQLIPKHTAFLQNYPNPFNPDTWIPFELSQDAIVTIHIYDIAGRLVRKLELGNKPAGFYMSKERAAYWNGCNEAGEQTSSSLYFYTIQAGNFTATKRMILLK